MGFLTIFDWISPVLHALQPGETEELTPAQMNYLKSQGYKVHTISAFETRDGKYCVKVEGPPRQRQAQTPRPKRSEDSSRHWYCDYCGNRNSLRRGKCKFCGAPIPRR
jgi:hypothetical protein